MSRIQTFFLFLALCTGNSQSWFWFQEESTSTSPTETLTTNASTTPAGPTTAAMTTTNNMKVEEDDLSGMGQAILDVASRVQDEFVEAWNASRNTDGASGKADPNSTGNANTPRGEGEREGSGSGSGPAADAGSGGESVPNSISVVSDDTNAGDGDGVGDGVDTSLPPCLPVPSDWPICSAKHPQSLTLPNIFNHTSVDEVGAVLAEWAWLVEKGCHPSAEWFLCLLLVPGCPGRAPLPCRSFCQTLRDSCWAALDNGRLPVACHHLPDAAPERSRPTCASVSNWKGNLGGLECLQSGNTF